MSERTAARQDREDREEGVSAKGPAEAVARTRAPAPPADRSQRLAFAIIWAAIALAVAYLMSR